MDEERDEVIEQIADALRPLPEVDRAAKARVLVAVAAERERWREEETRRRGANRWRRWVVPSAVIAAALVGAAVMLQPRIGPRPATIASAAATAAPTAHPVTHANATAPSNGATLASDAAGEADAAPQPVQLVFSAPTAKSVRVVGDFNAWDGARAPMSRDDASGLWSVTLSLRPGRHVYAFLVNDSTLVRDPRAPAAPDADFGRPSSLLLVGRR